jgi:hypothetical protein
MPMVEPFARWRRVASTDDGVLTISVPRAESLEPRRVEIREASGSEQAQPGGSATTA